MVHQGFSRRLVAVLSVDVVGYSRLMEVDEEGTHGRLKAHRVNFLEPTIANYRGRIVKATGDGAIIEFPSVVNAVRSAVEIQRGMAERNANHAESQRITFRIGINLGDVIDDDSDIYGDGVNIAVRLESLADPGGICISQSVHYHVKNKAGIDFEPIGNRHLKNIAEPVFVYRAKLDSAEPGSDGAARILADPVAPTLASHAELRNWIEQLTECADQTAACHPVGDQIAASLRALADWFDEPDGDHIGQLGGVRAYLERLAHDAGRFLLMRSFTPVPIADLIGRLGPAAAPAKPGQLIENDRVDHDVFYDTHVAPALAGIDAALAWLKTNRPIPPADRDNLRRDLKQLRYLLISPSFHDQEVDRVRQRIEPFREPVVQAVTALIQDLFGQHLGRLSQGIAFRDGSAAWLPEMVVIPTGHFLMGSTETERRIALESGTASGRLRREQPQHPVEIGTAFAVGRFAVSFEEWDAWASATGAASLPDDRGWGRGDLPVVNISWHDLQDYLGWLCLETGKPYRLLSEAEWEYACRAGTTTAFHLGDTITSDQANFDASRPYGRSEAGAYLGMTRPVGRFAPNAFGLHQMHGNVSEWVEDRWQRDYEGAPRDGSARVTGSDDRRVLRGGSWNLEAGSNRSACRLRNHPNARYGSIGFRVARTLQ